MKKILIISSLLLASMVSVAQPAIREPIYALSDSNRERIDANRDYFLQILAIQDSLMAGQDISVNHLQSLMPQNKDEFLTFAILEEYACEKKGNDVVMSEKNIFESVWKYAIADTLDMMERYVEWFNWCDGWIAEEVWTIGISVEEKHLEKFQKLLRTIAPNGIRSGLYGETNPLNGAIPKRKSNRESCILPQISPIGQKDDAVG